MICRNPSPGVLCTLVTVKVCGVDEPQVIFKVAGANVKEISGGVSSIVIFFIRMVLSLPETWAGIAEISNVE